MWTCGVQVLPALWPASLLWGQGSPLGPICLQTGRWARGDWRRLALGGGAQTQDRGLRICRPPALGHALSETLAVQPFPSGF